jgi:DNA/RNA-binding domain of Phe-tRNA-synthetase-like protein
VDAENNAHARRWTFRQSARSVVTADTDHVLIVAEALHPNAPRDLDALDEELEAGLAGANVHIVTAKKLSATDRRLEF